MTTRKKGGSIPTQPLQKANGQKAKAPGRPTKLDPVVVAKFIEYVKQGISIKTACGACRLDFQTIQNWCERGGREKKGLYFDFLDQYREARNEALIVPQLHWRRAMPEDWKAARAWLRVRDNEHFGEKDQSPTVPAPTQINILVVARQIALALHLANKKLPK